MKDDPVKLRDLLSVGVVVSVLVAAALALPAAYWLLVALHEAMTTGTVQVNPASRGATRAWVPWPQAWAHLTGLVLIISGGLPVLWALLRPAQSSRWAGNVLLVSLIAAPAGIVLWFFSGSLVTASGVLYLLGFFGFVTLMYVIDTQLGRRFTWMVLLALVGSLLFVYAGKL